MYLVVGLGNPGSSYQDTRHNVGFRVLDLLAKEWNVSIRQIKYKSLVTTTHFAGEKVMLMKPQTYMNNSGMAVIDAARYYDIDSSHIIVVCDDIDIPFGTIRIRKKGSAGTHNGLKSIIYHLQKEDFPRVKISVGENSKMDLKDFVLSTFSSSEQKILEEELNDAKQAVMDIIRYDVGYAMNQFNGKSHLEHW